MVKVPAVTSAGDIARGSCAPVPSNVRTGNDAGTIHVRVNAGRPLLRWKATGI
jgi:hypothetical protein